jgi:hypothetical protein
LYTKNEAPPRVMITLCRDDRIRESLIEKKWRKSVYVTILSAEFQRRGPNPEINRMSVGIRMSSEVRMCYLIFILIFDFDLQMEYVVSRIHRDFQGAREPCRSD